MEILLEHKSRLAELHDKVEDVIAHRGLDDLTDELKEISLQMESDGFWDQVDAAQKVTRRRAEVEKTLKSAERMRGILEDLEVLIELAGEAQDEELLPEIEEGLSALEAETEQQQLELLLSGEADGYDALLTIHPGAGGTESTDWANMLYRMYTRWAEQNDFSLTVLDYQPGDEAGIKSVTIKVVGPHAYGYLKAEAGVHRLVRISPFDAAKRRHTSFASVFVSPDLPDDVVVEIDKKDLREDVFRASGAGGQHINKTSSAVRLTHLPTGLVVQCQNERSQHQNRDQAMKVLQSRLYELELAKREAKLGEIVGEKMDNAWGSQIRSYVFHPYQMVKDHRTGLDVGNLSAVMDGDVGPFIRRYLLHRMATAEEE